MGKNKSMSVASTTNSINVEDAEVTGEITDLDEVVVNQKDSLKKKKENNEDNKTEKKDNNNEDSISIHKPNNKIINEKSGLTELLTDSESNRTGITGLSGENYVNVVVSHSRNKGLQ